jgi:hypothetical protein
MKEFIQKLPMDIVLQIIPYTYNLQNKNLLCDIINYNQTKNKLLELYKYFWTKEIQSEESEEYKYWLKRDLFIYANNYNLRGYDEKFYKILARNIFLQSEKSIDTYITNLHKKELSIQINVLLALLNIDERNELLIYMNDSY